MRDCFQATPCYAVLSTFMIVAAIAGLPSGAARIEPEAWVTMPDSFQSALALDMAVAGHQIRVMWFGQLRTMNFDWGFARSNDSGATFASARSPFPGAYFDSSSMVRVINWEGSPDTFVYAWREPEGILRLAVERGAGVWEGPFSPVPNPIGAWFDIASHGNNLYVAYIDPASGNGSLRFGFTDRVSMRLSAAYVVDENPNTTEYRPSIGIWNNTAAIGWTRLEGTRASAMIAIDRTGAMRPTIPLRLTSSLSPEEGPPVLAFRPGGILLAAFLVYPDWALPGTSSIVVVRVPPFSSTPELVGNLNALTRPDSVNEFDMMVDDKNQLQIAWVALASSRTRIMHAELNETLSNRESPVRVDADPSGSTLKHALRLEAGDADEFFFAWLDPRGPGNSLLLVRETPVATLVETPVGFPWLLVVAPGSVATVAVIAYAVVRRRTPPAATRLRPPQTTLPSPTIGLPPGVTYRDIGGAPWLSQVRPVRSVLLGALAARLGLMGYDRYVYGHRGGYAIAVREGDAVENHSIRVEIALAHDVVLRVKSAIRNRVWLLSLDLDPESVAIDDAFSTLVYVHRPFFRPRPNDVVAVLDRLAEVVSTCAVPDGENCLACRTQPAPRVVLVSGRPTQLCNGDLARLMAVFGHALPRLWTASPAHRPALRFGATAALVGALGWACAALFTGYVFSLGAVLVATFVAYLCYRAAGGIDTMVIVVMAGCTLFALFLGDILWIQVAILELGGPLNPMLVFQVYTAGFVAVTGFATAYIYGLVAAIGVGLALAVARVLARETPGIVG